ncbi:MAG: tetratricopeptide repeat protein, partial [marine benthic group bacterium]|nr:tetratricopeptide repeat protein [Gemmatimonadota bacterium]
MFRELLHRRVPQIVGGYLATSWILLEFTDWAVGQYALSPALTNLVVTTLLLFLPAVAILAWRHGAPGEDGWTRTDAAVVGLNLIVAGGIQMLSFGGEQLGAVATVTVLEDDEGNTVERLIPTERSRRELLVWDFDNASGNPDLDWLRGGLWAAFVQDLSQDLFVTPVEVSEPRLRDPLSAAGFELPYEVPLAMKRRLAAERGVGHFLEGEITAERDDTLVVETKLYETRNARLIAEREYRGVDPLEMVDRMTVDARRDLGIPEWQIESSLDLPSAELLTESPEAFRAFAAYREAAYQNRTKDARAAADAGVALDSTFAAALGASAFMSLAMGEQTAARQGIEATLRYSYRLPERSRLIFQMLDRMLFRMDPEGALQTGRYWAEVYPADPLARQLLAQAYQMQGDREAAIEQYRAVLSLDPGNVTALEALAATFSAEASYDSALSYYGRLAERRPGDVETRLNIADTHARLLDFEAARSEVERTRIADPENPEVLGRLARLDMQLGDFDSAAGHTEEMAGLTRTPRDRDLAAATAETLYYQLGQYDGLLDAWRERRTAVVDFATPIEAIGRLIQSEILTFATDWDRSEYALAQIDSLRATVEEPWSLLFAIPSVQVYLDLGDLEAARRSLDELRRLDEVFGGAPARQARIRWAEARMAEQEDGDCHRALPAYEGASELAPTSATYRAWLASCQLSLERWEDAEREIEWLLARYPGDAKIRMVAARLFAGQGDTADAIGQVEAALEIWSDADRDFRPAREAARELER